MDLVEIYFSFDLNWTVFTTILRSHIIDNWSNGVDIMVDNNKYNTIQSAVCFTKNIVASAPGLKCRDLVDKYFPLALDQVVFTAKLKSHIPSPPHLRLPGIL